MSLSVDIADTAIAGPSTAHADVGGNSAVQRCKILSQFSPTGQRQGYLGGCIGFFQQNPNATIASTYEYFCKVVFIPAGVFTTQGECVSFLISIHF
jgi:hypothetical protein